MSEILWRVAPRWVLLLLALGLLIGGMTSRAAALPGNDGAPSQAGLPDPATSVAQQRHATDRYDNLLSDSTPTVMKTVAPSATPGASPVGSATWTRTFAPSSASVERVIQTILPYIEGQQAGDSLLEIEDGAWVKSSNYHGVTIEGMVYYYAIMHHQSFDPLRRGAVATGDIDIVTEIDDGDFPIVIYRITDDANFEAG